MFVAQTEICLGSIQMLILEVTQVLLTCRVLLTYRATTFAYYQQKASWHPLQALNPGCSTVQSLKLVTNFLHGFERPTDTVTDYSWHPKQS